MRTGVQTLAAAKRLRREMTRPELDLWFRLKGAEDAPRFRRQHPLGPYVLDFYCPAARLVVEIDGSGHSQGDQPARDEQRDAWLAERGLEVLRIPASDVLRDPDEVAEGLVRLAVERASPLRHGPDGARGRCPPLPQAGEGTARSVVEEAKLPQTPAGAPPPSRA